MKTVKQHGSYPFRLGTTSFIIPDNIIPNVKKLGGFFDEIELLVFESMPDDVLPSKDDVQQLLYLSEKLNLTYNIHMPVDVSLTCESAEKRQKGVDMLLKIIELFAPLNPTTHTLHLEMEPDIKDNIENPEKLQIWEKRTRQSLGSLVSHLSDPGMISIETLDYPFEFVESLVEQLSLSVCIDAGHQIKHGYNLMETFERHKFRTPVIHLHGVDFSQKKIKDHTGLDKLPKQYFRQVQTILKQFTGVVSLEVFNARDLNCCLAALRVRSKIN